MLPLWFMQAYLLQLCMERGIFNFFTGVSMRLAKKAPVNSGPPHFSKRRFAVKFPNKRTSDFVDELPTIFYLLLQQRDIDQFHCGA